MLNSEPGIASWWGVALASLLTGMTLQPILIPWLRRRGVMDVPNHRSSHRVVTPRGGGIAVLAAVGAGLLVAQVDWQGWAVFAGSIVLGAVGLADDFGGLGAKFRLSALLVVGGVAGAVFDSPLPLLLAVPAMALWTAAYVNAFNFMDGINGISALTGIVAGAAYVAMGGAFGSPALVGLGAALLGACLSFLPFNLPHARVFLGDVGSYGLGFIIAASAWLAWGAGAPLLLSLAPTLVYLADTGWTLLRRARAGAPLMEAHREHAYQQLVDSGLSATAVSLGYSGSTALVVATSRHSGTAWLPAVVFVCSGLTAVLLNARGGPRRIGSSPAGASARNPR